MKTKNVRLPLGDRRYFFSGLTIAVGLAFLLPFRSAEAQQAIASDRTAPLTINSNGDLLPAAELTMPATPAKKWEVVDLLGAPLGMTPFYQDIAKVVPRSRIINGTTGVSTWNGGSGNWSDGTMWSPNGAPNDNTADVFIDGGNPTASVVTIDNSFTVGRLTIDAGDTASLNDNRQFTIVNGGFIGSGSLVNNGTFTLNSGGNATDLRLNGDMTVSGSGTINTSNLQTNRIYGLNGTDRLTIGASQTIQGSMQFGVNLMKFTNNGTINATLSNGITVDPTDAVGDAVNNGVMQASSGSFLQLNTGNYTNTGATIRALTGGTVNLNGSTIVGGTLTTTDTTGAGGVIQATSDSLLQDLTNSGYLSVPDNRLLRLAGTITNNGVIQLNSVGNAADLRLNTDVILNGSGTVTATNIPTNRILGNSGVERLTIGSSMTVQGSMQLGVNQMKFTNNGLINANLSNGMTIDPTDTAGDAVNNGTMRASNGAAMTFNAGNYTNNGTIEAVGNDGGVNSSTVRFNTGSVINGGILNTTDTSGNNGIVMVNPGNSTTLTNVTNNGLYRVNDNSTTFLSGIFTNDGVYQMNSQGNITDTRIVGDVSLAGAGSYSFSNSQANRIFSQNGGERLTVGSGVTLEGAFNLGLNQTLVTNNGIISASLSVGVNIDPSDGATDFTNNGTLRARNGATLTLQQGSYTNTNGVIQALTGSAVDINNGIIIGGTVTTTDLSGTGGVVETNNNGTLTNVTNTGYLNIPDNRILHISGTLTNNGVLNMNSGGNTTDLRIEGGSTIQGTGSFTTTNTQANRILATNGTDRLTIASGTTVGGSMQFGANQMKFTNNGTIDANLTQGINVDPTDTLGDAINNNIMQASSGGTLTLLFGNYTNNGTIRALNNSLVNLVNGAYLLGGTVTTVGTGIVQTGNDSSLDGVTNGGTFNIPDNTRLRLFNGFFNNGTLNMNSGGNNTELRIGTDLTISGTGTISTSNSQQNRVFGVIGTERLTIANGYTVQGAMQFGANQMKFTNNGTINANLSAGLTIDPTDAVGDAINNGTLQASNGANLSLLFGNYSNANGVIQALNNSVVTLFNSALIDGGIITTSGTGIVQTGNDSSLQNVTNDGTFNIPDNTRLRLFGTFTNNGSLNLNSGGNNTELRIGNDVTLSGIGALNSTNTQANRIFGVAGSERLTISNGYTLQGSMQLGANQMKFTNNGTINANQSAGMTIDPTDAVGDAVNTNLMEATSGSTLTLAFGNYTNTGGTIQAATGSFVNIRDIANIIGGTLTTTDLTGTGGVIQTINDANLQDLTNNGFFRVVDNTRLRLTGTIVNNGIIQMNSGGNNTELRLNGDVTLNGIGTLIGSTTQANRVFGLNSGNETLTNGPTHTIAGTMLLGVNQMNLINQGLINGNQNPPMVIDPVSTAINTATGIFRASNGATLSLVDGTYTNNGTYEALDGSLIQMSGSATLTNWDSGTQTLTGGSYRAVATSGAATLNLNIGQIVHNAASIILDGTNTIIHTSDNTTDALTPFNDNTAAGSFTITNGRNFDRTFDFNNAGIVTVGPNSLFTTVQFELSGTLTGAGTLTDSGAFNWTAGTQSGPGTTNSNGGMTISTSANKFLDSRLLNLAGVTNWTGSDNISAGNGGIFSNAGTFNASTNQAISYSGIGTAASFNNNFGAIFNKTGSGTTTAIDAIFSNSGNVNINSGVLSLQHGGTDTGIFADASGAALTFAGGTHNLTNASSTSGAGAVNFSLGIVNFANGAIYNISGLTTINGGTANFDNSAVAAATVLSSGALGGGGTYSSSGSFTWSGGTINGSGITNANNGLTLSGALKTFIQRTLNNNGNASWIAGNISAGAGAIFNNPNSSTFTDSADLSWLFDQGGALTQFNNGGTFTKSAGAGTTTMEVNFSNTGILNANSGTLAFSQGVQGTSGTVNIGASGTLDVSGGTTASSAATLSDNGNLALGSNNFNVASDYVNGSFGSGNSFNPRANVTGTGGINATGNVNQSVSGDVTGGTGTTPLLAFGNFHVGDPSVTKNYAINNTGSSGPVLRGAIQTAANGGNITDGRLSGAGVTAANFGPLALGGNSGNLGVTFNPNSPGALNGQVVHLINNFDNVQDQNLSITGAVYRLATASTHSPEPVVLPNQHMGDAVTQALSISNTAVNDGFSEKLDASFTGTTGTATASGSFNFLAPGSTNNTSLLVGVDTSAAGARSGTATVGLVSDGTGTSGLANSNLTSQTVHVSGNVYRLASASTHTPEPVAFGIVHIGDTPSQALSIGNTATNDGFSEKLDGSIAASTGGVTATGSFSLLAPQSTSSSLSVGIDTSSAGNKNGTATITLTSNGTGTSDLASTPLTSQTVNVTGQVNFLADPVVIFKSGSAMVTMNSATSFTINFGQVQPNSGTYLASFGVNNFLHNATFQDSLGGTWDISMVSHFGASGFASFSGIAPGSSLDPNLSFDSSQGIGSYSDQILLNPTSSNASGNSNLSQIQISLVAQIIPEPSTYAMLIAGGVMLLALRRFARRCDRTATTR